MAVRYEGHYRAQGASTWIVLFPLQSGLSFAWNNTSALPAGTYEVEVHSQDTVVGSASSWSATRTFQIQHVVINQPPPPPAITTPTQGQTIDASVTVQLTQVSDPEGSIVTYRAERRLANGTWVPLFGATTNRTYVWDTSSLPGGSYEIRAYASDGLLETVSPVRTITISHTAASIFLSLSTVTVEILTTGAGEDEPFVAGSTRRNFDGRALGSHWGTRRRRWRGTTRPLTDLEYVTFRTATPPQQIVQATGLMLGGATVPVLVKIRGVTFVQDGLGHRRSIRLTLLEV